jgi:6-phosphogluconolactonase (cycloisomerase 2 family)
MRVLLMKRSRFRLFTISKPSAWLATFSLLIASGCSTSGGSPSGGQPPSTGPGGGSSNSSVGQFLYIGIFPQGSNSFAGSAISLLQIGSGGTLTNPNGNSPAPSFQTDVAGNGQGALIADPQGQFVFGLVNSGIAVMKVDRSTGYLSPIPGSPFAVAQGATNLAISPDGKLLFSSDTASNLVESFTVDRGTGSLSAAGSASTQNGPSWVTIDPSGKYVFVTNMGSASLSAFTVDARGTMTALAGSPFPVGPGPNTVTASSNWVYVASSQDSKLYGFKLDASSNTLTPIPGSPFSNPGQAGSLSAIALTPDGKFLFSANSGAGKQGAIDSFRVDQTSGALGPAIANNGNAIFPGEVLIDPSQQFVYTLGADTQGCFRCNSVASSFRIDSGSGALTLINGIDIGNQATAALAVSP